MAANTMGDIDLIVIYVANVQKYRTIFSDPVDILNSQIRKRFEVFRF